MLAIGMTALAVIVAVMMTLEWLIADSGVLRDWQRRPPPLMLAVWPPIVLALVTALAPIGRRIVAASSFAAIVGIQSFRLPPELLMHHAATAGVMPVQLSYSGRNFDIVTGALAMLVALRADVAEACG